MKTRHALVAALFAVGFLACTPAPEPGGMTLRPESQRHLQAAQDSYARGEFDKARTEAQKAVEADPGNADARRMLNDIQQLVLEGRPATDWEELLAKLRATYETTAQAAAADAEACYRLAERYYQAGDFEKAFLECEKALQLNPNHAPAKALHMEVQFLLGRGKATPQSQEYDKYMKGSLVRHQQTMIELDNAMATAQRAQQQVDYEGAAAELLKIREYGKWMPPGVELQARQQQAQELLKKTVEGYRQRDVEKSKARLRLLDEERPFDDTKARQEYSPKDLMDRAEEALKQGVFGNAVQRSPTELLVIEKQESPQSIDLPRRSQERYETRGGDLTVRRGEKVVPLPLKHTDVKAQISIYVAAVDVTQQYHNPYDEKIEAVYSFPLPDDAAVRDFVMTIGTRRIRGIIREREEAKAIYIEARRQGYVASLLTQERPNVFTQ